MNKNFATITIVFAILFGAAFQCGKEGGVDSDKNNAGSGKLTEAIVKQVVTKGLEGAIGTTGPHSIDVAFETIKFGTPIAPSERDKLNGIRSDIYYPVLVKYTVIQHYRDADKKIDGYEDCKFYINSYGEWTYKYTKAG